MGNAAELQGRRVYQTLAAFTLTVLPSPCSAPSPPPSAPPLGVRLRGTLRARGHQAQNGRDQLQDSGCQLHRHHPQINKGVAHTRTHRPPRTSIALRAAKGKGPHDFFSFAGPCGKKRASQQESVVPQRFACAARGRGFGSGGCPRARNQRPKLKLSRSPLSASRPLPAAQGGSMGKNGTDAGAWARGRGPRLRHPHPYPPCAQTALAWQSCRCSGSTSPERYPYALRSSSAMQPTRPPVTSSGWRDTKPRRRRANPSRS